MKQVQIILSLPPKALKAQQGVHPKVKQAATARYRSDAVVQGMIAKAQVGRFEKKVIIDHTWLCSRNNYEKAMGANCPDKYRQYKPRDAGNAITALKAAIDGLVEAGLLIDDRAKFVQWGAFTPLTTYKETRGRCGVILTITEVSDSQ